MFRISGNNNHTKFKCKMTEIAAPKVCIYVRSQNASILSANGISTNTAMTLEFLMGDYQYSPQLSRS